MRYLYTLTFYLILPFVLLRSAWRARTQKTHLRRIGERIGFYRTKPQQSLIWLHAVSFGETIAAEPLIGKLKQHFPTSRMIITSMTLTGAMRTEKTWQQDPLIQHVYLPFDIPFAIKRFLKHFKPKVGIIMETELWPNLLYYVAQSHIPLILANARLSERSFKRYLAISKFMTPLLKNLTRVGAQSEQDAKRFSALGIPSSRVCVLGNVKYDIIPHQQQISEGLKIKKTFSFHPIIVAASTHANEEEQLLDVYARIQKLYPKALLILVPRHPERFNAIANLCRKKGHQVARRSLQEQFLETTTVYLGDTMGELYFFYALADIAFVGGSLVPIGGHNLLEPAALKLPIITGPHLFNFKLIQQLLLEADTLHIATDQEALFEVFKKLLEDPSYRQKIGAKGFELIQKNQGATLKYLEWVLSLTATTA